MKTLTTQRLERAAIGYLVKKKYSCYKEFGLNKRGRLRADVLGINMKGEIILCEIKASIADFRNDSKWWNYKNYAHKVYLVIPPSLYIEDVKEAAKDFETGVLVLCPTTGYLRVRQNAVRQKMDKRIKRTLLYRMAWRAGEYSARNTRRTRQFLD